MKKSFSLFIAIAFIVILSFIGYMTIRFSASSTSNTSRNFLDLRSELLLRSSTEAAILALQGHEINSSTKCLNRIDFKDTFFDVNITYHYFLKGDCKSDIFKDCKCSQIDTADTNGSVLVYVEVKSRNKNWHIRKVRFTLQNP